MLQKGTKLYSILNNKCPRCQEGDFFEHKLTYHPKKVIQQKETCSHCNLKYMIEPSFFFGAMYVSYAISVALVVIIFGISSLLFQLSILQSFAAVISISLLLTPVTLRLSRIIWINFFIHYNSTKAQTK